MVNLNLESKQFLNSLVNLICQINMKDDHGNYVHDHEYISALAVNLRNQYENLHNNIIKIYNSEKEQNTKPSQDSNKKSQNSTNQDSTKNHQDKSGTFCKQNKNNLSNDRGKDIKDCKLNAIQEALIQISNGCQFYFNLTRDVGYSTKLNQKNSRNYSLPTVAKFIQTNLSSEEDELIKAHIENGCDNCNSTLDCVAVGRQNCISFLDSLINEIKAIPHNVVLYKCKDCGKFHYKIYGEAPVTPSSTASKNSCINALIAMLHNVTPSKINSIIQENLRIGGNYFFYVIKQASMLYIQPVAEVIRHIAHIMSTALHMDETYFYCLHQKGQGVLPSSLKDKDIKTSSTQYILGAASFDSEDIQLVIYEYMKGRSKEYFRDFIKDFKSLKFIEADRYPVYEHLCEEYGITLANCLVHVRRYLFQNFDYDAIYEQVVKLKEEGRSIEYITQQLGKKTILLLDCFYFIKSCFAIDKTTQEGLAKLKDLLDRLYQALHQIAELPNSGLEKNKKGKYKIIDRSVPFVDGILYALNAEKNIKIIASDIIIPLSNNKAERLLRLITIRNKLSSFITSELSVINFVDLLTVANTLKLNNRPLSTMVEISDILYINLLEACMKEKNINTNITLQEDSNGYAINPLKMSIRFSFKDFLNKLPELPLDIYQQIADKIFGKNKVKVGQEFFERLKSMIARNKEISNIAM